MPVGFGAFPRPWTRQASNLLPPGCKPGALPNELRARAYPTADSNREPSGPEPDASSVGLVGHVVLRADGWARTSHLSIMSRVLSPMSYVGFGALGAIRTHAVDLLKIVPLPLGYEGVSLRAEDSNFHHPLQRRVCCRLHQLPMVAGGPPPPAGRSIKPWRCSGSRNRTRVLSIQSRGARPAEHPGMKISNSPGPANRTPSAEAGAEQGRQDSNLQQLGLESRALPIELRPYGTASGQRKSRPVPWLGGRLRVCVCASHATCPAADPTDSR